MNLADIRKKAAADKKALAAAEPAESPAAPAINLAEPDEQGAAGEMSGEEFDGFPEIISPADCFETVGKESEESPAEIVIETVSEPLPPVDASVADDVSCLVVDVAEAGRVAEGPPVTETAEILPAAAVEIPLREQLPSVTAVNTVKDFIGTILAGRESVMDAEASGLGPLGETAAEIEEYLCFKVAEEEYAINIMAIKEIIKPREVTEVPRMPVFVSGVISLRGVIIPIIDMRLRLSLPVGTVTGKERIIVVKTETDFFGILVDWVVQVARIRRDEIEPPPAILDGIDREFVKGLGHFDGRMIILLNLETILNVDLH